MIVGGSGMGTLFGVYHFLEKYCGVRWLWPGKLGEVIPRQEILAIKSIDETDAPDYLWRELGPGGFLWKEWTRENLYSRMGVSETARTEYRVWERRQRFGYFRMEGGHVWGAMFPPQKYGEAHPEYFALSNGKRDNILFDVKHRNQLCTSNPDVIKLSIAYVRDYFEQHPNADGVSISPNDGMGWCMCEKCRAQDIPGYTVMRRGEPYPVLSDRMMKWAGAVGEAIAESHPDKYLTMLAYGLYRDPPKNTKVPLNVIVQPNIHSEEFVFPEKKNKDENILREWSRFAPTLGIYEYMDQQKWTGLPKHYYPQLADMLQRYHAIGTRFFETQAGTGFAVNGMNYYVLGKMLWDVSLDYRDIVRDYCQTGFGEGWQEVESYFQLIAERWTLIPEYETLTGNPFSWRTAQQIYDFLQALYPDDVLNEAARLLNQASDKCSSQKDIDRIAFLMQGLEWTTQTLKGIEMVRALQKDGMDLFNKDTIRKFTELYEQGKSIPHWDDIMTIYEYWMERERWIDAHRNDFMLSYQWVKSNVHYRPWNPIVPIAKIQGATKRHHLGTVFYGY
ncbi:DUF4838 domain-containing protein [candidate division KSB1 bacterium]|nr:DUF4838 domain-containing protein [candidate division KSB1 bacterium]